VQDDLFDWKKPAALGTPSQKMPMLEGKRLLLRLDQALLLGIILLVFYVVIFSWGVERGKTVGISETLVEAAAPEVAPKPLLVPQKKVVPSKDKSHEVTISVETITQEDKAEKGREKPVMILSPKAPQYPLGKYTIQHVTYLTDTAAQREIQKLKQMGHEAFVIPSGRYLQVCINAFRSRKQAMNTLKTFKTNGITPGDAFVRIIPH